MKNQNTQESLMQDKINIPKELNEKNRRAENEVITKSKNKNDGVQLSSRYLRYEFAKRHLRGTRRPQVFPLTTTDRQDWLGSDAVAWSKSHRTGKAPEDYKRKNRGKTELRYKIGELNTLSAGDGGGNQSTQNFVTTPTIRRLTPVECERLQGFPDNWTKYDVDGKEVSDTQRYKMMGNAVTTNVVSAIIEKLLKGQSATH